MIPKLVSDIVYTSDGCSQHTCIVPFFRQLVDIFGGLLDRPIIKEIFDPYYPRLITMMDEELDSSKIIYDVQMERIATDGVPPVHQNFPKVIILYRIVILVIRRLFNVYGIVCSIKLTPYVAVQSAKSFTTSFGKNFGMTSQEIGEVYSRYFHETCLIFL